MDQENLFKVNKKKYGNNYKNHLFEQYKLYVESAEKISDRRQNANNYFITINTAFIALLGLSFRINFLGNIKYARILLALIGIIICVIFWFLLRSYKQINEGKFKVIHKIEERMPLALYDFEWKILEKGKNKKVYYPFSHVELLIPRVFGFIYLIIGIICFFIN